MVQGRRVTGDPNKDDPNHWDHCLLTVDGGTWLIARIQYPRIHLHIPPWYSNTVIVRDVDWDSYCDRCLETLDERYPGWR